MRPPPAGGTCGTRPRGAGGDRDPDQRPRAPRRVLPPRSLVGPGGRGGGSCMQSGRGVAWPGAGLAPETSCSARWGAGLQLQGSLGEQEGWCQGPGGRVSCSRRERAGLRCCWWEGREGPGRTAARPGWSVPGAAEDRSKLASDRLPLRTGPVPAPSRDVGTPPRHSLCGRIGDTLPKANRGHTAPLRCGAAPGPGEHTDGQGPPVPRTFCFELL